MILDPKALEAAKHCFGDAMAWGCEPQDALGSAIAAYLEAAAPSGQAPLGGFLRVDRERLKEQIVSDPDVEVEARSSLSTTGQALHGPYGWLIMPEGLSEEHWQLSNDPEPGTWSEPLFAQRELVMGDAGQAPLAEVKPPHTIFAVPQAGNGLPYLKIVFQTDDDMQRFHAALLPASAEPVAWAGDNFREHLAKTGGAYVRAERGVDYYLVPIYASPPTIGAVDGPAARDARGAFWWRKTFAEMLSAAPREGR